MILLKITLTNISNFVIFYRYELFHRQQKDIVNLYPAMVHDELQNYDEVVCKFFAVDRGNKKPV